MTPLLAQRSRPDRAFERIYRRHVGDVYRYALALMRNESDAEDVTQTTFLNAYRAFQRGERPNKPQNWLIAIAHNVCRQRFRQASRRPAEVAYDDDAGTALVETDDAPSADDIRRALGHLAFNQRAALVMRELEGRTYAEIAEILELSPRAVETLIFRARRALREQLESSLSCGEAELAISRQLDGHLTRAEKGALRAHLRECATCAAFARRQRAQRSALRSLAVVPLPSSLASFFGGSAGSGLAVKAAVALSAGVAIGSGGYAGVQEVVEHQHHPVSHAALVPRSSATAVVASHLLRTTTAASTHSPNRPASTRVQPARNHHAETAARRRAHRSHALAVRLRTHGTKHAHPSPPPVSPGSHRHVPVRPVPLRHRGFPKPLPPQPPLPAAAQGKAKGHLK
jgi:RNA polymerase sigma factor (sigma-70 family)